MIFLGKHDQNLLKMLYSKGKTLKKIRALRAQSDPKSSDSPNSRRGVLLFSENLPIRLGGFYYFTEIHQFGLGGFSKRGVYFELHGNGD